jgi:hypothetical protein
MISPSTEVLEILAKHGNGIDFNRFFQWIHKAREAALSSIRTERDHSELMKIQGELAVLDELIAAHIDAEKILKNAQEFKARQDQAREAHGSG